MTASPVVATATTPDPAAGFMHVRVPDRDTTWGSSGPAVVVRSVAIARRCPTCGGPRGHAYPFRFPEDGEWFTVDRWDNPCGHLDLYTSVLAEVAVTATAETTATAVTG
jgi:hypothetical protein